MISCHIWLCYFVLLLFSLYARISSPFIDILIEIKLISCLFCLKMFFMIKKVQNYFHVCMPNLSPLLSGCTLEYGQVSHSLSLTFIIYHSFEPSGRIWIPSPWCRGCLDNQLDGLSRIPDQVLHLANSGEFQIRLYIVLELPPFILHPLPDPPVSLSIWQEMPTEIHPIQYLFHRLFQKPNLS